MKFLYQFLLRLMPFIFILGLILSTILLLIEMAPSQHHWPYLDKVEHAVGFFMLASSAWLGFPKHAKFFMLGLVFYGALMEVLQSLLTVTREASFWDLIADVTGILVCVIIAKLIKSVMTKSAVAA